MPRTVKVEINGESNSFECPDVIKIEGREQGQYLIRRVKW